MKFAKNRFLIFIFAIVLIFGLVIPGLAADQDYATIIYYNGDIVTVDQDMSYAEAVAVKDGKIIAVGSEDDIMKLAGSETQKIDLEGKTMVPGFVDAHGHFSMVGISLLNEVQLQSPPAGSIKNIDDMIVALQAKAEVTPKGEAVIGTLYDDYYLEDGRHPTRWDLDKVSTEHPIKVNHFSYHGHVVNSYALEKAGIDKNTPDPEVGVMGRDANGEPNGQFFDCTMVPASVFPQPPVTKETQLQGLALGSETYAAQGATTVNNGAGSTLDTFKLHEEAIEKGYLKVRSTLWTSIDGGKQIRDYVGNKTGITRADWDEKGMIASTGIKYFSDGSPQLRTAFMTDPYFTTGDLPEDWVSHPVLSPEQLIQDVVDAHEAGFEAIYIHANGDAAVDMVLDAYEEVRKEGYRQSDDLRHTVIHCQFNREDQYDRMAEIGGIIPSHYILHTYFLGDRHKDIFFGEERAKRMSAAQDAIDRGIIHNFHSDTPVLPHKPLEMIWCGVNRLSYHGQEIFTTEYDADSKYRSIDQRVSPEEALKAVTINAAYGQFIDDVVGSIEVGKWADFVVLDENPLKVDPLRIKDIKILETIVGGEVVFAADADEPSSEEDEAAFKDVADSAWYAPAINYIATEGITTGTGDGYFSPNAELTRGQLIVMLLRAYDVDADVDAKDNFADAGSTYYTDYLAAAKHLGISEGVGDNLFEPEKNITRQEMFVLLYNTLDVIDKLPAGVTDKSLVDFADADQVAAWAEEAMELLVETGTVGGVEGKLLPTSTTSRAEFAQVLYNLLAN
jgi:predicted amidohydrolase YtcJ